MTEVVSLKSTVSSKKALPGEALYGDDAWVLKICAEWRSLRSRQQMNWAENDAATLWGTLPGKDVELDLEPLQRMQELQDLLAGCRPRTLLLAREMLRMCTTILAHEAEDPEATLSQGPVLEIIRNVAEALGYLSPETKLGYE